MIIDLIIELPQKILIGVSLLNGAYFFIMLFRQKLNVLIRFTDTVIHKIEI